MHALACAFYSNVILGGMAQKLLKVTEAHPGWASMGIIPCEFTLTLFGETDKPEDASAPQPDK